jgi:HSF-type DNA-binding
MAWLKQQKRRSSKMPGGLSDDGAETHLDDHSASSHRSGNQERTESIGQQEYQDRSQVPFVAGNQSSKKAAALAFPAKLFEILDLVEKDGLSRILSWQPHGRCFVIHRPKDLESVLVRYFPGINKARSFQRQASLLAHGLARLWSFLSHRSLPFWQCRPHLYAR